MTSPSPGPGRAPGPAAEHLFYGELAPWWPLVSPPEEYAEEAAFAAGLLRSAARPVREVLELGSGGGSNAVHLRTHFRLTLADLSAPMLDVSRRLNPDCAHVQGDMRTLRLGRDFDAVLVHDAVDYMAGRTDLRAALRTAYAHLRPGGVAVLLPDHVTEAFAPETDWGGSDAPDGRGVRFLAWTHGPYGGPEGETVRTEYTFTLREADGRVRVAHETHATGLFPTATWLELLAEAGFRPEAVPETTGEDRTPRTAFLAHRPA